MTIPGNGPISSRSRRGAFTLIEILVVIVIVGLLVALTIPAVQLAREAARRSECANNMRQIGLALHSYAATHSVFPRGVNGKNFSFLSMLLPYIDQKSLYNSINFSVSSDSGDTFPIDRTNETAFETHLSSLLCPSDPSDPRAPGLTNYAGNGGVGSYWRGFNGLFTDGAVRGVFNVGFGDIGDGSSHTAAASEWVIGAYEVPDPLGLVYKTELYVTPDEFDEFVASCHEMVYSKATFSAWRKSACWLVGGYWNALMNHNLMINDHSCTVGGGINAGAWTAGSRHRGGGANVLFADGHARFVRDSITLPVWRALGTRSGGETYPEQD